LTKVIVGLLLFNPVERRIEVVVKRHPDGKVSVFTISLR